MGSAGTSRRILLFADPCFCEVEMRQAIRFESSDALERWVVTLVGENLLEVRGDLSRDADLFELGLDSMGIMQLIVAIEERFGVRVPSQLVTQTNFRSSARIAALIREIASEVL